MRKKIESVGKIFNGKNTAVARENGNSGGVETAENAGNYLRRKVHLAANLEIKPCINLLSAPAVIGAGVSIGIILGVANKITSTTETTIKTNNTNVYDNSEEEDLTTTLGMG